jgi:hypothetical protein
LEKFDIRYDDEIEWNVKWPICSLSLIDLTFPSRDRLPPSLLSFIRDCPTLQELKITWTRLSNLQWSSLVENILKNAAIQNISFRDESVDSAALQSLLSHPTLSRLSIGQFEVSQTLLQALFSSKTIRSLDFHSARFPDGFSNHLSSYLESHTTRVSEFVLERDQDVDYEPHCRHLEKSILSGSILSSTSSNAPIIIRSDDLKPLVLNVLGLSHEKQASVQFLDGASFGLPSHVAAVIPAPTNSKFDSKSESTSGIGAVAENANTNSSSLPFNPEKYQFNNSKAQLIVVQRPAPQSGMKLNEYMSLELMPLLIRCMHHLSPNGHLLVVDDSVNNLASDNIALQHALEQITSEMVKRMSALFDASRVGAWVTSRTERGRINLIKPSDSFPVGLEASIEISPNNGASEPLIASGQDHSPRLWCWRKEGTNLQLEYGRFILSHELYRGFDAVPLKFNQQRDLQALLEQWFMLRANGEDADRYPVDELASKRVCSLQDAEEWVSYITRKSLETPLTPGNLIARRVDVPGSAHRPAVVQLEYGQFEENIQASRADALLAAASRLGSQRPLDDLLCMMMRYGTVFGNFRQFCTNENLFQECVDVGVHCEGFASPFNAQILLSKPPVPIAQWQPTFCSCYEDTDGIFGSLGSFFLQSFDGMHIFLNPPTVDAVLTQTMNFIHDQMERGKCQFHVLLPAWDDLQAYQFGANSKRLTRLRKLDSQQYPSQNPYSGESHPSGKKFVLMSFASEGIHPAFSS